MKLRLKIFLLLSFTISLNAGEAIPLPFTQRENAGGSAAAPAYGQPQKIGQISNVSLAEISGITPSRTRNGLLWVHNDSGDQARLYVINTKGALLGRFTVPGARNRDWEDLAGGPGRDGKPALYIADFGDNGLNRDDLRLYRVKEPDLSKGLPKSSPAAREAGATEAAEVFPFRYPDGRHNAEALFVDPKSGRPYVVTKTMSPPCGVYRFPMPLRPNEKVMLEKLSGDAVSRISRLILVTGAAASPDGKRVVVRTYFGAFEMTRSGNGSFESLFDSTPVSIKLAAERQGEAICYTPDGRSILTTSEMIPAPIYQIKRSSTQGEKNKMTR